MIGFAALDFMVHTVVGDYLYMSYRTSVTEWHSIYRIHTDGTGFEQLAAGVERLYRLAVDPDSETIFYVSFDNPGGGMTELLILGFGETTPTLIFQECAFDVDFVADDGFFLPGDTNLDRDVDITDFTKLLSNFGPVEFVGPVPGVKTWYDGDWDIDR